MNDTYIPNKNTSKKWYLIDASDQTLGRLSTKIASILQGKNNIDYTPFLNTQSYIIIINAQSITVTGQKKYKKLYKRHSGQPGGLKIETFEQLNQRMPNKIIEKAVKGMLPKGPLGRKLFTQLKVYANNNHPHEAQQPEDITLK
ncbi:50S ribosomal protein L13 (plastid) [Chondrus crispus]|uniref:50S ribosomal protein L13 n=1 Tax=Chondrus crispus TaxID=2769 RepID=M5DDD8_CHOCR|nr:50S ribosomal protein L13 [Chondrus crispus]CCP38113.1 50S ribosomal protein L13 [Chondrus crispus]|eukprot:YP_007627366.1 50S ribosomal protein L13 (plastid) [Chondrus crispus]